MPLFQLFYRDTLLAETRRGVISMNTAFFCPHCGEVWGRVRVAGGKDWLVATRACDREPNAWDARQDVPGSFFNSYQWWGGGPIALQNVLRGNPALVEHEFRVHLQATEKG